MRHIGLDLGIRGAHQAAVFEDGRAVGKPFKLPPGLRGLELLETRGQEAAGVPFEVVMEPTGLVWLPLAAELSRRGHAVFVPNGAKLAALRTFYARRALSDTLDASVQAMVRHVDPDGTVPLTIPTAAMTMLRMVVKQRARLMKSVGSSKTRIRSWVIRGNPSLKHSSVISADFEAPRPSPPGSATSPEHTRPAGVMASRSG
jgi:transposase